MKEQKILLIFKDGIVNLDDVAAIVAAPKSAYVYVLIRNREKHLLFQVFGGNGDFKGKRNSGDLLVSVGNVASDAAKRKHGNFPLCLGLFGDGNGNIEVDIVDLAHFVSYGNKSVFPRVNTHANWIKFFVRLIDSFRNRFKAFGNKFFKFHKFNSVKKDTSDN